jgi:beta-lactamase superfamily II metal-dependent hydrolase
MPDLAVTMLPAKEGDCLLVEYGPDDELKYVLIDAGRAWTYKHALKQYLEERGVTEIELLVVTHVDRDHIDGMLSLMQDETLDLNVRNVWFNTYDHLIGNAIEVLPPDEDFESFGARMGEELSPLIVDRGWSWNRQFEGLAVALSEPSPSNSISLGELRLTLLSPDQGKLDLLRPVWESECEKAGITPGASLEEYVVDEDEDIEPFGPIDIEALAATPFEDDHSEANGTSIAFLLEYDGRKVLLAGDAHVDLLIRQLKSLGASEAAPLAIDAFKVPHHGSRYNLSRELLELMACRHYLVSTNGNYFKHPDDVAMSRLVKFGTADATIHFNYRTDYNRHWQNPTWEDQYEYKAEYPEQGRDGYKRVRL